MAWPVNMLRCNSVVESGMTAVKQQGVLTLPAVKECTIWAYCVAVPASTTRCNSVVGSSIDWCNSTEFTFTFPFWVAKEKKACVDETNTHTVYSKGKKEKDGNSKVSLMLKFGVCTREDPASCMNCFIMPACTREARYLLLKEKRTAISDIWATCLGLWWKGLLGPLASTEGGFKPLPLCKAGEAWMATFSLPFLPNFLPNKRVHSEIAGCWLSLETRKTSAVASYPPWMRL